MFFGRHFHYNVALIYVYMSYYVNKVWNVIFHDDSCKKVDKCRLFSSCLEYEKFRSKSFSSEQHQTYDSSTPEIPYR